MSHVATVRDEAINRIIRYPRSLAMRLRIARLRLLGVPRGVRRLLGLGLVRRERGVALLLDVAKLLNTLRIGARWAL